MSLEIVVTGATGNVGSSVVQAVRESGCAVRAASRDPRRIVATDGVRAVALDYDDAATFDEALRGADGLFLVAPPLDPAAPEKLRPVIARAVELGVAHIVLNSAMGVEHDEEAPLRLVEHALTASGTGWTIVRPNFFMENFTSAGTVAMIRDQSGIFVAAGDALTGFIATLDVARVVAAVFAEKLVSQTLTLTGPDALGHGDVAQIIGEAAGREVTYYPIPEVAMLQGARDMGLPEGMVQYMGALYSGVRAGYTAAVTDDVERITGQGPMSFARFAQENAAVWA